MSGAASAVALEVLPEHPNGVLGNLMLARFAADNGATRGDLMRDLAYITAHRFSPSELRSGIDGALERFVFDGCVTNVRGRFRLAEAGTVLVEELLGARKLPKAWAEIRDIRLVALALGVPAVPMFLRALARPDGLRALILQKSFDVGGRRVLGASQLRMALAVIALKRAFGNKIKGDLEAGRGLSVKASRLLAGQLARRPRDFRTDTRLIAALAVEAVGASQSDPSSLRQAILRAFVSTALGPSQSAPAMAGEVQSSIERAPDAEVDVLPAAASRPDLEGFSCAVLASAATVAQGWPGNRKAFISHVWRAISEAHAHWGLSDIEFKSMLAEAHRTGHVVLGSADIKNKDSLKDVQDSAIAYKNTVWHFIRVEN